MFSKNKYLGDLKKHENAINTEKARLAENEYRGVILVVDFVGDEHHQVAEKQRAGMLHEHSARVAVVVAHHEGAGCAVDYHQ